MRRCTKNQIHLNFIDNAASFDLMLPACLRCHEHSIFSLDIAG